MIIGFGCIDEETKQEYDYAACMYPEGMISTKESLAFNHDQIDKITFMGCVDEEEKEFKSALNEVIETFRNRDNNSQDEQAVNPMNNVEPLETQDININQNINVENNNELSTDLDTL